MCAVAVRTDRQRHATPRAVTVEGESPGTSSSQRASRHMTSPASCRHATTHPVRRDLRRRCGERACRLQNQVHRCRHHPCAWTHASMRPSGENSGRDSFTGCAAGRLAAGRGRESKCARQVQRQARCKRRSSAGTMYGRSVLRAPATSPPPETPAAWSHHADHAE